MKRFFVLLLFFWTIQLSAQNITVVIPNPLPTLLGGTGVASTSASQIQEPTGSAATPSYSFSAGTSTGLYRNSNALPQFTTVGTPTMDVNITGPEVGSTQGYNFNITPDPNNGSRDTGLSRDSAGVVDVGNGTQGDKSGRLNATIVAANHPATTGSAPSCSSSGLGTGTCTLNTGSGDSAGVIVLSPAGAPAASGNVTLTFATFFGTNSSVCVSTLQTNTGSWNARATLIHTASGTPSVNIAWDNNAVALTAGSIYWINYVCSSR